MLNEFEAALRYNFSPTLLRWFTSYSVIDKKKLDYIEKNEIYYYMEKDLDELNDKMKGKWPKTKSGLRPTIPEGIKREIKQEARFSCPACNKPYGEVAHIDPVYVSQCNHPINLIFLCPDHHTEFDNALIPSNITKDEVVCFKKGLIAFQRIQWKIKGEIIQTYLNALNTTTSLFKIQKLIQNTIDDKDFNFILDSIASKYSDKQVFSEVKKKTSDKVKILKEETQNYINSHSENICPLCNGVGFTDYYDSCPVCLGAGEVAKEKIIHIDLSQYDIVDCQLCTGKGTYKGFDCPACNGEGQVNKHFDYTHEWSMYKLVNCRLCDGEGSYNGFDCPACNGEGQVANHFDWTHDWSRYELTECRLCKGDGMYNGYDCPACNGDGQVDNHFDQSHDWSKYELTECRLCKGDGTYNGYDCPACNGDGQVDNHFDQNHDWSKYELTEY